MNISKETAELCLNLISQVSISGDLSAEEILDSANRLATAKQELSSLAKGE